jgi:hypothetical protein
MRRTAREVGDAVAVRSRMIVVLGYRRELAMVLLSRVNRS